MKFKNLIALCLLAVTSSFAASVTDYGATGNGSTDDTTAIQNAINAVTSGTLTFPAGTYKITKTLNLKPGVTYQGQGGAKLQGNGSFWIMASPQVDPGALKIDGFVFDEGGIQLNAAPNSQSAAPVISNNVFQNLTTNNGSGNWTLGNMIFAGLLRYTTITNNTFENALINGTTRPDGTVNSIAWVNGAIMAYGFDQSSIDHNNFDHIGEGIKICLSQSYQAHNGYIGYNSFTNIHRMALESQGSVGCGGSWPPPTGSNPAIVGYTIEYNSITSPLDPYWETYGLSLATPTPAGADTLTVANNFIQGGIPSYWSTQGAGGNYGYGIEVGGSNLNVSGNSISGLYSPEAITVSASSSGSVANNFTCAAQAGAPVSIGAETGPSPNVTYSNNSVNANCTNQPNPTAGKAIGVQATTSTPVTPAAPAAPVSIPTPVFSYAIVPSGGTTVAANSTLQPANIGVSTWIKASAVQTSYPAFVSYGSDASPNYESYIVQATTLDSNNAADVYFNTVQSGATVSHHIFGKTKLQVGQLYQIGFTYDGTNGCLYVNGVLDGTLAATGPLYYPANNTNGLGLAKKFSDPTNNYNGAESSVEVWSSALTDAQMLAVFQAGATAVAVPVVAPPTPVQPTSPTVLPANPVPHATQTLTPGQVIVTNGVGVSVQGPANTPNSYAMNEFLNDAGQAWREGAAGSQATLAAPGSLFFFDQNTLKFPVQVFPGTDNVIIGPFGGYPQSDGSTRWIQPLDTKQDFQIVGSMRLYPAAVQPPPACATENDRGTLNTVLGANGARDSIQACLKSPTTGNYSWVSVVQGPQ